jgi:hypothetical protein
VSTRLQIKTFQFHQLSEGPYLEGFGGEVARVFGVLIRMHLGRQQQVLGKAMSESGEASAASAVSAGRSPL